MLRGPFAQMYGNASGGVVQVFTPDPPRDGFSGRASTGFGSDGQWQAGIALAGGNDRLGGSLDAWTYQTDATATTARRAATRSMPGWWRSRPAARA